MAGKTTKRGRDSSESKAAKAARQAEDDAKAIADGEKLMKQTDKE